MSVSNITINASNCNDCLCLMFTSSTNLPIVSLNCFTNGPLNVICQMFTNATYLGFNSSQIKINFQSTFYYQISTLNNQSKTTLPSILTTAPITTEKIATTNINPILLTSSTISSTTGTTTAPTCSPLGRGTIASLNLSTPSNWTKYSYSYTAISTNPMLTFGFMTEPARTYYLDEVSVVDIFTPNIQLLDNPSFENSTELRGWGLWCSSSCITGPGKGGNVTSSNKCLNSSGICFADNCVNPGINILGQSFSATIGDNYTISYWLLADGGAMGGPASVDNHFYVDIN